MRRAIAAVIEDAAGQNGRGALEPGPGRPTSPRQAQGPIILGSGVAYLAALIPIPRSYFWFKRTDLLREVRELFGSERRDHRPAEQRDELASSHSITSSA